MQSNERSREAPGESLVPKNPALGALRAALTLLVVAHHAALAYISWAPPAPASLLVEPRLWLAFPVVDAAKVIERGKLAMDPDRHSCTWDSRPVTLTVTEFLILQSLAQRPGIVKSRDALMDAAYDDQVYVDDRTIDSHIKRLRKKFNQVDEAFDGIETLYGVGYRFKEQ